MPTIGELLIHINASTASFVEKLQSVKNLSFETSRQIERSFSLIGTAALGMVSVAAGAMAEGIKSTAEWEVHVSHLAEAAGTSTETMSGLSFAAKMMSLDVDVLARAMARLDKQVASAQAGNAKAQQNMSILGIDVAGLKMSDELLMKVADHIAAMPDGMARVSAASAAFGVKLGPQLIPLLALGSKGIQDFMDQAKAMGIVVSKDQAEQAERFEQNVTRMKESLHGLWVEITNKTLPVLNDLVAKFQDTEKKGGLLKAAGQFGSAAAGFLGSPATSLALLISYARQGQAIIDLQEKQRKAVQKLTVEDVDHAKAVEALKKSYDSLESSLELSIKTVGMGSTAAAIAKINFDAEKAGIPQLTLAQQDYVMALSAKKTVLDDINKIDSETKAEQKLLIQQAHLKALQDELPLLQQQADLASKMDLSQFPATAPTVGAPQASQAFEDSAKQLIATLERQRQTFGMTADQVALYDLKMLDANAAVGQASADTQAYIDKVVSVQAQLKAQKDAQDAVTEAAKRSAEIQKQWGDVAVRSIDDMIFSGKKFSQVLQDILKYIGELIIKQILLGDGKSGSGLFGALFSSLGGLFGFASGGGVSAGQPIIVGESGPEVFVPSSSGAIIPNASIGGATSVNIVYQIDARGSQISEEQFRRSLAEVEGRAVHRALSMARETQLRT